MIRFLTSGPRRGLALAALAGLAACGTTDAPDPLQPSGPTGRVRFVNLITDPARNPVNLALEGVPWNAGAAFGNITPASLAAPNTALYSAILTGNRSVVITQTSAPATTLGTIAFTVVEGADYTVYATGGTGGAAITNLVTRDTNAVVAATSSRVRVVHLAPAAGTVDIFVTTPTADITTATPTLANVPVRAVSGYLTVLSGTYRIRIVPAGTAPAARVGAAILLDANNIALPGGSARTFVARDAAAGGLPIGVVTLTDR